LFSPFAAELGGRRGSNYEQVASEAAFCSGKASASAMQPAEHAASHTLQQEECETVKAQRRDKKYNTDPAVAPSSDSDRDALATELKVHCKCCACRQHGLPSYALWP